MTPSPAVLLILSEDLIAEILSFLPVKSLLRFRCVSKSWKTLISEPRFVKLHLEKSQSRNPKLLTLITEHVNHIPGNDYEGNDSECEEDYSLVRYSIDRLFENPSFTLVDDPNYHHLYNKGSRRGSFVVGSCNGLILLADRSRQFGFEQYRLRVWNPATRTASEEIGYFCDPDSFRFALGCVNSTGTYKVVAFCDRSTRVLNLGGDHVWRNIESFPVAPFRLNMGYTYAYLSGTLNWLAIHSDNFWYKVKDTTVEQFGIVSLDLGTETYNQYTVPSGFNEVPSNAPTIGVLGGCLCFSYTYRETDFVIWQMKKFGVEDSWTQLLKISYHDLLIDCDFTDIKTKYFFRLRPFFISEDVDSLILQSNRESGIIILYNRRDNRTVRTHITASRTTTDNRTSDEACWVYEEDYVESLVPIF